MLRAVDGHLEGPRRWPLRDRRPARAERLPRIERGAGPLRRDDGRSSRRDRSPEPVERLRLHCSDVQPQPEVLPGISGVSLVVPATESEIPRLQRQWRARGNRQLTLVPAGTAEEHLFSVLNHPAAVLRPGSAIFGGLGTPREGRFLGWLLIGMRGQDFINETLWRASQDIVATSSRNRALTDSLTGLANRRAFMDRLDQSQCR